MRGIALLRGGKKKKGTEDHLSADETSADRSKFLQKIDRRGVQGRVLMMCKWGGGGRKEKKTENYKRRHTSGRSVKLGFSYQQTGSRK